MSTAFRISGVACLAAGMLLAQAPDPARDTLPGATTSSTQDRNNAAPGSMNRSTQSADMNNANETVTGYLVDASCSRWPSAGMPARTMASTTTGAQTPNVVDPSRSTYGRSTVTAAMSPTGDVTSTQVTPRDRTMDPVTQREATVRRDTRAGMNGTTIRTDTRASATEMANSENMIEDHVNNDGQRVPDLPATTQLTWSKPPTACSASLSTTQFGIFSNGKMYVFDAATNSNFQQQYQSNEKMKMALSNGTSSPVLVTATGSVTGDTIHVHRIHRGQ